MMTTGPVAALACVTLKPQSLGEFGSTPSVFQTTAFPGILGNLVAVPRTPKPPSLASQDTWPKQATNGQSSAVPIAELGACDLVPVHTGVW